MQGFLIEVVNYDEAEGPMDISKDFSLTNITEWVYGNISELEFNYYPTLVNGGKDLGNIRFKLTRNDVLIGTLDIEDSSNIVGGILVYKNGLSVLESYVNSSMPAGNYVFTMNVDSFDFEEKRIQQLQTVSSALRF